MDPAELKEILATLHGLHDTDRRYTFYYDETNNIRRLHMRDNGLNVPDPACFLLGGVAHEGPPRPLGLDALRPRLNLPPDAQEMKLKHLGRGDFLAHLRSPRVAALLDWVEEQSLLVHYQVTDPLYWSTVDIIDSIQAVGAFELGMGEWRALKNALYSILRADPDGTADLMRRHHYPNIGPRHREFLDEIIALVDNRREEFDGHDVRGFGTNFVDTMLKHVLQAGRAAPLPFLTDETAGVLIEKFGIFFSNRMQTFAQSDHILDDEHLVAAYLESGALGGQAISYRFADSRDEEGIQVADAIVGLLGKAFTYCTHSTIERVARDLARLSDPQARTLATLARLLDRSTDANAALALRILSDDDEARAALLLDPKGPGYVGGG